MGREQTADFVLRGCGAVLGAVVGALTCGLLAFTILLYGLMGSGHGGTLEGTGLEPVAWIAVPLLPVIGIIGGAVVGMRLVGRRLAKRVDQPGSLPELRAESDTEASTEPKGPRTLEPREGDNDG